MDTCKCTALVSAATGWVRTGDAMSGWLGWSGRFLADFDPAYPIQANFSEISARCARRQFFNQILRNTDLGQAWTQCDAHHALHARRCATTTCVP